MLKTLFRLLRVEQWYKNILIFIALFFSLKFIYPEYILLTIAGFFVFCFISSASYIINDLHDIEDDKQHKEKKTRPIASGKISRTNAMIISFCLIAISLILSLLIGKYFVIFPVLFFINTNLYTFYLKKIAIIDIESIAINYILRVVSGAILIEAVISPWLIVFVFILALFLVICKRKSDLAVSGDIKREVYKIYNEKFLDSLVLISSCSMIVFYALYAFMAHEKPYMMLTIPVAIFLALRFLYFLSINDIKSRRVELLFKDKQFTIGLLVWVILVLAILYLLQN